MIAGGCRFDRACSAAFATEAAGQLAGLGEIVEADLDGDLAPLRAHLDLAADGRLELVGGGAKRLLLLRSERTPPPRHVLWLASQLSPFLGLADRPTGFGCVAGEAAAHIVAL